MTTAEKNALLVALNTFASRYAEEMFHGARISPARFTAAIGEAFRAGWQASSRYAEREGGPG